MRQIKATHKTIVLAGGCFDILHKGHLKFLKAAKKQGGILIVALENDENVRRLKGKTRPVNSQNIRSKNLLKTGLVDNVVLLPTLRTGENYLKMVQTIEPDVIAVTAGDPQMANKQKQAKVVGAKVKVVIERIPGYSTTNLINKKGFVIPA